MKYNEQDMAKLISEVETEFKDYLTKAEQDIETSKASADEASIEKKEELNYDADDISEMNDMYASMNKSEQEAHYSAIKSTLFIEEKNESKDLNKSEEKNVEEVIAKSEMDSMKGDLKKSEEANVELKKNIETLTSIVSKIVKRAPARKAVTQVNGIEYIKKTEETVVEDKNAVDFSKMSKKEVNSLLTAKLRSGEITKSEDRENINKFCYGQIDLEKIKYLL